MAAGHRLLPADPPDPDPDADPTVLGLDAADDALEALTSETAREVVATLAEEPATASDVADRLDLSIQTVHYHLRRLDEAGVVGVEGSRYSTKGFEMDVYAPTHRPLVLVLGDDAARETVANAVDGGDSGTGTGSRSGSGSEPA